VLARVVARREHVAVALAAVGAAVMVIGLTIVDDLLGRTSFLPGPNLVGFTTLTLAFLLGAVGPWLAWARRGSVVDVQLGEGGVRLGARTVAGAEVTGLAVAEAERGVSVAIARGGETIFVELESLADAMRIARALGKDVPSGDPILPRAASSAGRLQMLLSATAAVFAPLYWLEATTYDSSGKAMYGIGALVGVALGAALFVARCAGKGGVAWRRGAFDAHAELHAIHGGTGSATLSTDATGREGPLARGDRPLRVWLADLDAATSGGSGHAYRSDALAAEMLWEVLRDDGAAVEERMAAARVLARRDALAPAELVRVVSDPEVRLRVEAALPELDEAEEQIEALGPMFQARKERA